MRQLSLFEREMNSEDGCATCKYCVRNGGECRCPYNTGGECLNLSFKGSKIKFRGMYYNFWEEYCGTAKVV